MSYATRINEAELIKLGMSRATIAAIRQLQNMVTTGTIDLGLLESLLLINPGPETLRPEIDRLAIELITLVGMIQSARNALDDAKREANELRAQARATETNSDIESIKRRLAALEAQQYTSSEV